MLMENELPDDIVFLSRCRKTLDNPVRKAKWEMESKLALIRKRDAKANVLNRRSSFGKPIGWALELFTRDLSPPRVTDLIEEPEPAKPDPRASKLGPLYDPVKRFRQALAKPPAPTRSQAPGRPQQDLRKTIMTEATTTVGNDESFDRMDEELPEFPEEDSPELLEGDFIDSEFDLKKVEKEWEARKHLAQLRQRSDSDLLAQIWDSHALQGEKGLADMLGQFFPHLSDVGHGQPDHVFWHAEAVCPRIKDHLESSEFRATKLFVPVDRSNASFMAVIRFLQEVDEMGALRKRAVSAYYCCFAIFYGQKPKQSTHIEHTCFRHDCDKRIVTKAHYDHAEDFSYDNSVNIAKRILGYVKEGDVVDVVAAYIHAWKRLAGRGRWLFTDKATGVEWIAVPWFWKHTKTTESRYLGHFDRCFAEEHCSFYIGRSAPEFKADPEAVFDLQAWLLAKKAACFHTPERSFQEVADAIWLVLFRERADSARKTYDAAVKELAKAEHCFGDDLSKELVELCQRFPGRAALVTRATEIVFERAPRPERDGELVIGEKETYTQAYRNRMTDAEKEEVKRKNKEAKRKSIEAKPVKSLSKELHDQIKEKERIKKAEQRKKAAEKKKAAQSPGRI